jgi:2-methylcitrate dehydratase PrpD
LTGRIAEWVTGLKFPDLPRRTVEEAKNQILSVVAAVHAGHFSEVGRSVSRTVKEWGVAKEATMIPSGERLPMSNAIFGNTALSMALDYDDYLLGGHTGHAAVLVTLALAEKFSVSGKNFLAAQVAANEVAARAGLSLGPAPLHDHSWPIVHAVGSTVVAGRVFNLDEAQTRSAFGLALAQPPLLLSPPFFGSESKALVVSSIAPAGVHAAQLAAGGLRGCEDIFENGEGVVHTLATQPFLGAYEGLGRAWLTDTLSCKIYPGSRHIDSSIDCILGLVRQHSIEAKKVKSVHVYVGQPAFDVEKGVAAHLNGRETIPAALGFSIGYNVAAALADRELTARQLAAERIRDEATWDLVGRIQVSVEDRITEQARSRSLPWGPGREGSGRATELRQVDLSQFRVSAGARVRVEMADGRSFEAEQETPFGAAGRPFDERRRAVEEKFRRETRYTLRKEKMERAIDLILHLEEASSAQLRELVRLCCSERG